MPKIPEILIRIQIERFVSVSSDRNIRDHLWRWSTYFGRNISTEIRRSIFDKQVLGWPDLIGKCRPIFLRYSHWSLTGHFGIMESTPENSFGPKLSRQQVVPALLSMSSVMHKKMNMKKEKCPRKIKNAKDGLLVALKLSKECCRLQSLSSTCTLWSWPAILPGNCLIV